jgi:protocatechuate 3,4-dioxygenase beta subunit
MMRARRFVVFALTTVSIGIASGPVVDSLATQTVQRPGDAVQRPASKKRTDGSAPTGVIRGHVTTADGRALRGAQVTAVGSAAALPNGATTDADGGYELAVPAPDAYILTAIKDGYDMVEFGQPRPSEAGKRVRVSDAETVDRIDFTLPRAGAIIGRVVDDNGDPIDGATVSLLESRLLDGRRQLVATEHAGRRRTTNDLGRFRLFGVQPGQYVLSAAPALAGPYRLPGYALTYYPGTASAGGAEALTIGPADERSGVEIRLLSGVASKVSGTAFDSRGEPYRGRLVIAASQRSGIAAAPPVAGLVHADGSFEFTNIAPGDYVIQATERGYPGGEFAYQYVSVIDADVRGVAIRTAPGSTMSGRIILEGDARGAKPQDFSFLFMQTDFDRSPAGIYRAKINDDWTFSMAGLTGPLLIRPTGSAEWLLKSVRAGGVDLVDTAVSFGRRDDSLTDVEVVLTRNGASVEGSAADERGQPAADYAVVVFAADRTRWYRRSRFVRSARSDADGAFHVRGLPSAEYFVAALPRSRGAAVPEEWQDPAFLERLSAAATRVTLTEGHSTPATLRLIK